MESIVRKTHVLFGVLLLGLLVVSGCNKHPKSRVCKNDGECHGFAQSGRDGVCYMGQCQECVQNSDCISGHQCVNHQCLGNQLGEADFYRPEGCENIGLVHFDFDKFSVNKQYYDQVQAVAECMKRHPDTTLVIEGYADDRGTASYNMALGERRANSVRERLVSLYGITPNRINTVSYGMERPLMNDHNEVAWSKNRRAAFNFLGGKGASRELSERSR